MGHAWTWTGCAALILLLAGCGGRDYQLAGAAGERNVAIDLLIDYDSNQDGLISGEEFDGAIRADFARLDVNSDGVLDSTEASEENARRWARSGSASTPLIDWNTNGWIDFAEFSGALRSTFQELDLDDDGSLNSQELAEVEARAPQRRSGAVARSAPLWPMFLDNE